MADGRKVAIGFGIAALLGCLAYGGYHTYGLFVQASASMKEAAEPALTALAGQDWDAAALRPFATPPLQQKLAGMDTRSAFASLRPLGKVKLFEGAQGFNENYNNGQWSGTVEEQVQFDAGTAHAKFSLLWLDGKWQVEGLDVKAGPN